MALRAHRHAEVRHFINASGAIAYIAPGVLGNFDYRAMAQEMQQQFPALRHVLIAGEPGEGQLALHDVADRSLPDAEIAARLRALRPQPDDVATMLLSGGTTSMSKLIPRTHDDYVLNARLCGAAAGFGRDTVLMAILPLGHNYNLASPGLLGAFYYGGTVVLAPSTERRRRVRPRRARARQRHRGGGAVDLELVELGCAGALRPVVAARRAERRRASRARAARAGCASGCTARRRRSTARPKASST